MEIGITEKKNTYTLLYRGSSVTLSGDFDSGNLNRATLNLDQQEIVLQFGKDKNINAAAKCWFHFSIRCSANYLPLHLYFTKVNTLSSVYKVYDLYRPVVRIQGGEWHRHLSPVDFDLGPEGEVNFRMTVDVLQGRTIYIALCYPWSFEQNEQHIKMLEKKNQNRKDIYFNRQTLIFSPEKRPLHLIAISSPDVRGLPQEDYSEHLFPLREESHLKRVSKPMVLITARVHPCQVGASHALNGILGFLLSDREQVRKILSEFYFLIVPMLNPDGVFLGNNRMDSLGHNLNRFYHLPDIELQPSCFAIKQLVECTRKQLYAFFDLHGHGGKKSCFLFGNFIDFTPLQIDSVLYVKYLASICEYVEFKSCNFSKKQMSSKDKNQTMSKEGCARVIVHKWTNSPYCYTLQTGLFKNVKIDEKGIERYGQKFYDPEIYAQIGSKMIMALFRILKKGKNIEDMRKEVIDYVAKLERINKKEKPKSGKVLKEKKIVMINQPIIQLKAAFKYLISSQIKALSKLVSKIVCKLVFKIVFKTAYKQGMEAQQVGIPI